MGHVCDENKKMCSTCTNQLRSLAVELLKVGRAHHVTTRFFANTQFLEPSDLLFESSLGTILHGSRNVQRWNLPSYDKRGGFVWTLATFRSRCHWQWGTTTLQNTEPAMFVANASLLFQRSFHQFVNAVNSHTKAALSTIRFVPTKLYKVQRCINAFNVARILRLALTHLLVAYNVEDPRTWGACANAYFVALDAALVKVILMERWRTQQVLKFQKTHKDSACSVCGTSKNGIRYFCLFKLLCPWVECPWLQFSSCRVLVCNFQVVVSLRDCVLEWCSSVFKLLCPCVECNV